MFKMEAMTQEDCIFHNAWNYNPNMLEVLMHGHSDWSCMNTLLYPHCTSVLGEIFKGRGTTNITLKPRGEASKTWWNVLQHLHNISNELSLIFSFSLNPFGILLELSWPHKELALLSAWSLKQFGLVCPHTPQWWQKCFT